MTTVGQVISRADALVEKYGRYDSTPQNRDGNPDERSLDGFDGEVRAVNNEIARLLAQADEVSLTTNRATAAAGNAEIRKAKNELLQRRVEGLYKKARKGKNLSNALLGERLEVIQSLVTRVKGIPDGVRTQGGGSSSRPDEGKKGSQKPVSPSYTRVEIPKDARPELYQHTQETKAFEQDWDAAKVRQDQALERIEQGVGVLGNLAKDMNQELVAQEPVLDALGNQIDQVGDDVKTRNQQMKTALKKVRSSRNICFDLTLLVILLALGAYIYSLVR